MAYLNIGIFYYIITVFSVKYSNGQCMGSSPYQNVCRDRIISKPGDIKVIVLAQIHESKLYTRKCADGVSISGFQSALAIQWITEKLNGVGDANQSYIPGVTLGLDIYDDCGLASRATDGLLDLLPNGKPSELLQCSGNGTTEQLTAGVIAVTSLEATEAASDLIPSHLPLISALSTSPKLEMRENVYFTTHSLQTEIKAILQLLIRLQWHYIGIVYTDDALGKALMQEYKRQSKTSGVCSAYSRQIPIISVDETQFRDTVKNIITLFEAEMSEKAEDGKFGVVYLGGNMGAEVILDVIKDKASNAYELQWIMPSVVGNSGLENLLDNILKDHNSVFNIKFSPFSTNFSDFKIYHENLMQDLNPSAYVPWIDKYEFKTTYPEYHQEHILGTVNAVVSLAAYLKQLHLEHCKGQSGLCPEMGKALLGNDGEHALKMKQWTLSLSEETELLPVELQSLNSSMAFNNARYLRMDNTPDLNLDYFGIESRFFSLIGNYSNGVLTLADDKPITNSKSICKDKCEMCLDADEISFAYIPGDFLILGLFSVHGSSDDSDSVSTAQRYKCGDYREGTNSVISVLSFIESIKSLNQGTNLQFGGIALDDCYSPLNISYILAELFSGNRKLNDPASGEDIDMSKVVAVVGALSSKVTQVVADQLTSLNIPMLSYGASSAILDDRIRYPFFLRTVPSDTLQVNGLIELMVHFNFTHIGAIYYHDAYGLSGIQEFQRQAPEHGICVEYPENITEGFRKVDLQKLVNNLRRNLVDVVLFYGIDTAARDLLELLSMESSEKPFTFIASEAWGTNPQLISETLGNQAKGSLVFVTDTSVHLDAKFLDYLKVITPDSETGNPWMTYFWQDRFKCSFPESFDKKYSKRCNRRQTLSHAQAQAMYDDQRGVHVMHAVYAIQEGVRNTINDICGNTNVVCKNMRATVNAGLLTKSIRNSVITTDQGRQFRPFKEDGNGYMGFSIYNIQRTADNRFQYIPVGSYSQDKRLQIQTNNVTFYDPRLGTPTKSIEAQCSYKFQICNTICPQTPIPTTITDMTSSVTAPPVGTDSSLSSTVTPIVLGIVIAILVIIVILLFVLMIRQQQTTKTLIQAQSTHSLAVASLHGAVSTQNIYDEPRSNDGIFANGRANRGFDQSSSSAPANSSASSSLPVQYTHVKGVADSHSRSSNLSTPQMPRHLSSSVHSLASGGSQPRPSPLVSNKNGGTMSRRRSAEDVLSDSNSLTYMTAKDFDMIDEDKSDTDYIPMSDSNSYVASGSEKDQSLEPIRPKQKPIRRKLINSNNIEMTQIPKPAKRFSPEHNIKRPDTLPGINPQTPPKAQSNNIIFSNPVSNASFVNQDLYLNPVTGQLQSPIMNGITPGDIDFTGPVFHMQNANGPMMMVQSPQMEDHRGVVPQNATQPRILLHPNTYLPQGRPNTNFQPQYFENNQHFRSPTSQPFHQGDFVNQSVPNVHYQQISPNSRNMTHLSPTTNDVTSQLHQFPPKHVPTSAFISDTGYLVPNEYQFQTQMINNIQNDPNHIQTCGHPVDLGYIHPTSNNSNERSRRNIRTPDYINAQKESSSNMQLALASVPDVVQHSSLENEEEVII